MTNSYQEYEWTALTEADLLDQGGNGSNIGCGDTFTMPGSATVCLSTSDNDSSLSGDTCRNENANDWSGQQAYVDGEAVGGQMYAECYHVLKGSDGQTYYMIEIEIEGHDAPGAGGDYFSFYGDVPAAGTELTVVNTCNVRGNWVDYKCLGAGDKVETGSISGTVFCDVDCDGINGEVTVIPGCDYTIEAEDMYSSGFKVVSGAQASGGELAKLYCPGGYGALCTTFDGKSGTYDLTIRVQDENDGQSTIWLKVGGEYVEAVRLDSDSDGVGSNDGGFSTYVIKDVAIEAGEDVTLKVWGDGCEYVRIDNITLEGQDTQEVVSEPTKAGVTIKLVDLDGNVVATTETDADGNYRFDDVVVGDYKIMGVAPDGTEFTIQDAGSDDTIDSDVDANGMSGVVTVTAEGETDVDLGVCEKPDPGSLSGRYFCDENNNGVDDGEAGVAGVLVELLDDNGAPTGVTTLTDADGNYSFADLEPGTYGVKFTDTVSGKTLVEQNVGTDDSIDSDAVDLGSGMSEITGIVVEAGQDTPDNDAGVEDPGTAEIRGRYFCDENDDDVDNTEPGIVSAEVKLLDAAGNVVGNTSTDSNGNYAFTGLAAGTYSVMFAADVDGKTFVAQDDPNGNGDDTNDSDVDETGMTGPITVDIGEVSEDNDAGVRNPDPMTAELGDTVWLDLYGDGILNDEAFDPFFSGREQGVEGVTVQLLSTDGAVLAEQITDADGTYLFTGLAAGDYKVGFILPEGFGFTAANQGADDARDSDAVTMAGNPDYAMTQEVTLAAGESNLSLDAGLLRCGLIEGTSQIDENSPVGGFDLLVGCDTDDTIIGLSGEDTLIGNGGNDELNGDSYDDRLEGGDGEDDLNGGSENDILIGGAGNDDIDGESEIDTAVFGGNFADATIEIVDLFTGELIITSVDGVDRVRNVEYLQFDDGTVAVEAILPGGTSDAVGAPTPGGSINIDVLANDIELSEGTLSVAQVNNGGYGSVVIEADGTVTYTAGADFDGFDLFSYTVTNGVGFVKTVEVQVGDVPLLNAGDPGVTVLVEAPGENGVTYDGTSGDDNILGTRGEDDINGLTGSDFIDGGRGNDNLRGAAGEDTLIGGEGNDTIKSAGAGDLALGGIGDDKVDGQGGEDILFGGDGNDFVRGLQGSDFVSGGAGDDSFESSNTGDTVLGGDGSDEFVWSQASVAGNRDFFDGESGVDTLEISLNGADALAVQAEIDAYLAMVDANAPAPGSINDGSVLTDVFSFTSIELDIRNIEDVQLL